MSMRWLILPSCSISSHGSSSGSLFGSLSVEYGGVFGSDDDLGGSSGSDGDPGGSSGSVIDSGFSLTDLISDCVVSVGCCVFGVGVGCFLVVVIFGFWGVSIFLLFCKKTTVG